MPLSKIKGKPTSPAEVHIEPMGDRALIVDWGGGMDPNTHRQIQALCAQLELGHTTGIMEIIPAYTTVTVIYDPMQILDLQGRGNPFKPFYTSGEDSIALSPFQYLKQNIEALLLGLKYQHTSDARVIEIPVCYGGAHGPDLLVVAAHTGLSLDEVIALHTAQDYLVYMIGFAPGFPYLGGMSERLESPRRSSPRASIAPGSVGIGGKQTGIYPISTPGGWQIIGRTPRKLFRPHAQEPSLLKMGDIVHFRAISLEQYAEWKEEET